MDLLTKKGAALMTVIVVIYILTILSAVILNLLSNQTRVIEHGVSRSKAKYADEAAMVREFERLRKNLGAEGSHSVSGRYDQETQYWPVGISTGPSSLGTELNLTVDYAPTF